MRALQAKQPSQSLVTGCPNGSSIPGDGNQVIPGDSLRGDFLGWGHLNPVAVGFNPCGTWVVSPPWRAPTGANRSTAADLRNEAAGHLTVDQVGHGNPQVSAPM